MEGRCQLNHAHYLRALGYVYCPFCGVEIVIKFSCDHCDRNFLTEEAYLTHRSDFEFYVKNRCPGGSGHSIRFQKRRGTFYCPNCRIEYKPKPETIPIESEVG